MDLRYGLAEPHAMLTRGAQGPAKLTKIMVLHIGGSEWTSAFRCHHFLHHKRTDGYPSIVYTVSRMCIISLDLSSQITVTSNNRMTTSSSYSTPPPPAPSNKCHYRSCAIIGSDVPRMVCYAPGCDRVFHLYCYDRCLLYTSPSPRD